MVVNGGDRKSVESRIPIVVGLIALSEVVLWNTINAGYLNGETELCLVRPSFRDRINYNEDDTG